VIALGSGQQAVRAIRSLREVAPRMRIIVTCSPAEEPHARDALAAGADDYILEPVAADDLERALGVQPAVQMTPRSNGAVPSVQEILGLANVLRRMTEGLPGTLERLAALLRQAFDATGAVIQAAEQTVSDGEVGAVVLEEPLRQQDEVVGVIALGRRRQGGYTAADAGQLAEYARLIETILAQAHEQARWRELAWRDDLSQLHNRRYFDATIEKLITDARERRRRVTVVLFDIDDFKHYNDTYGHDTGDALIREVAVLLTRCSREGDVVARYGGDEFAVILCDAEEPRVPGSQHPTDPMALAERFCSVIRGHAFRCLGPDAPGPVTISGGLACFPWDGHTAGEIVRAADEALLSAKRSGKNHIVLAKGATQDAAGGRDDVDEIDADIEDA
jgi:diguanylate cyclase (GGDEF)-like protein